MSNKTRDESLDAACGLMIVYMIYGHICLWSGIQQVEIFPRLLYYFMPWFFFKSGMFFKQRPFKDELVGGTRKLLVPYLVFSVLGQLVFYVKWLCEGNTPWQHYILSPLRTLLHEGAVLGNSPLWFLLSLFCVRVICNAVFLRGKKVMGTLTILAIVLAYALCVVDFHSYFYISNICAGIFFYGCGYGMRKMVGNKYVLLVAILLYAAYAISFPSYYDFRSNEVAVKVYPFCMMACLGGVVSVNWMFRQLPFLQRPFVAIGKNSLTYYAAHWVVLGIASLFVQDIWHLTGYALFVSFVVANVLVLPCLDFVFRKYCPWSIGK